ncbi:MAG: IS21 family transposase [Clostridiales bacterium]|nr:IS21 family transposase [Clostridiales bacterium]
MTVRYCEILRLDSIGFSRRNIALSVPCSRNTVAKTLDRAKELGIKWPLPDGTTDKSLEGALFGNEKSENRSERRMPDFNYIRNERSKNTANNKKLLWTEYLEECKLSGQKPLMYSQFCYYIQKDEEKHRATMHINRKPGEEIEVDWAGDPAHIIDPNTGELIEAKIFVGVLSYSQYTYVEAFPNEQTPAWIKAHIHMFNYFGGVTKMLVPDNTKTAVNHTKEWYTQELNKTYHELAEHYGTAIMPARVRKPKDKPNAEGNVGHASTWIVAALRHEQFFSFEELNKAIRKKLEHYNSEKFQKKEGSRKQLFVEDEEPNLIPLPAAPYELSEWKVATVQYNYHVFFDGMYYSVPYNYIGQKVNLRTTDSMVEVFLGQDRIASHRRLYGRLGQYSTVTEHMPEDHRKYLEWNGNRFRAWAKGIGTSTYAVVDSMLTSAKIEQQSYRSCMGLLKMADKYSKTRLESACSKALEYTKTPSYKVIKNILVAGTKEATDEVAHTANAYGITRGADYYKR